MIRKNHKKRKICVVTGSRAEYGQLKPVMKAIAKDPNLELAIVAAGMHFSSAFGLTFREIVKDGFKIDAKVRMTPFTDTAEAMAVSVGKGTIGMAKAFNKIKPDIVLILGDRVEALAAAVAAAYSNISLAHISGGDKTKAGLDESARHAITKVANIHFPVTEISAQRIIKMGENPKKVFVSGAPGLDAILSAKFLSSVKIKERYGLDLSRPFLLIAQHPVTTEVGNAAFQITKTLEAVKRFNHQTIIIYPNSDAGGRSIAEVIRNYCERFNFMRAYRSVPHEDYLSLMKEADVLIGNSSSGITEAPSFHLPVVNIGCRQDGRERSVNVIDVPHSEFAIYKAIQRAFEDKKFIKKVKACKNPYGDGKSAILIANVLSKVKIDKKLLQKYITY